MIRLRWAKVWWTASLLSALASAQTPAGEETPPQPEVTPEQQAEIQKALEADAAAQAQAQAQQAAAAEQPSPKSGAFSLQSLNPDLSFTADVAAAAFSQKENLQTGGHDPTRRGFNLQQLELAVGAAVDPYFRFDANIVFFQEGVEIEEAYATTLALPFGFQVRAGQFLTRFGRQNATHVHSWDFVDQHFILGRYFGAEGNRGLGAEVSYLVPLPWFVELVGSVTDAGGEGTARSFFGAQALDASSPLFLQYTGALKQFFDVSDAWSILWGLSAATGPNPTGFHNRSDLYGTDLYVKYRPLHGGSFTIVSLQTEVLYRRRQIPSDVLQDFGGYAYLFWRFAQRWATAARYEYGSPALLRTGRIAAGSDYLDPEWTASRHRLSANVTFWPTEFSRLRLQLSADMPQWQARPTYAAFLAFEVNVGPHGAHKF